MRNLIWGYIYGVLSILFGSLFVVVILLPAFSATSRSNFLVAILLCIPGVLAIISGFGVFKLRKYGLYIAYLNLGLNIIFGAINFFVTNSKPLGMVLIVGSILYLAYFHKRRELFK